MEKLVLFAMMALLCGCTAETNEAWWIVGIILAVPLICWLIMLFDKKGNSQPKDEEEDEKKLTHAHHVDDVMKKYHLYHEDN